MTRLRVGVIGLGAIAQIQHLPLLEQFADLFEIVQVCDLSPRLADAMAARYGVPGRTTDWRVVCEDRTLDAVVLLNSGSHGPQAEVALANGLHVMAEKPLCFTVAEADRLESLALAQGLVLQVGYMKAHEAVMPEARREVERLGELRFVRHSVLHPSEVAQQQHLNILRFGDLDTARLGEAQATNAKLVENALGSAPAGLGWLYSELALGSIVHYLSVFRALIGRLPETILKVEAWPFDFDTPPAGWGPADQLPTLSVFASFGGDCRLDLIWAWLQGYPEYTEQIDVLSSTGGVTLRLPPPYIHHRSARLEVVGRDADDRPASRSVSGAYDVAFGRELRDFHAAVTEGMPVVSSAADARDDARWCQALVAALAANRGISLEGEAAASAAEVNAAP